ncbi:hypothetical protein TcG_07378 [Trypanosoma cruzi]|nr:hypothetical protein TcG_07378 [Trypanosoma cruzi]
MGPSIAGKKEELMRSLFFFFFSFPSVVFILHNARSERKPTRRDLNDMGAHHSFPVPSAKAPVPSPVVSRLTYNEGNEYLDGISLNGDNPPYKLILEWLECLPDVREFTHVPEAEIVSNGEAEALQWDLSVGGYGGLSNAPGENVHYISAVTLRTPREPSAGYAEKVTRAKGCCFARLA